MQAVDFKPSVRHHSALLYSKTSRNRKYTREYLPGYSGFVPTKNDFSGKTSGSINREIIAAGGDRDFMEQLELERHEAAKTTLPTTRDINPDVFGNHSKDAPNWIAGPTHMIR